MRLYSNPVAGLADWRTGGLAKLKCVANNEQ